MGESRRPKIYNDGQWRESASETWLEVRNPATDEVIALCGEVTPRDIDEAVEAAQRTFWEWRLTPPPRRAKLLFSYNRLLEKHREELACLIVDEHKKTLAEAKGELTRSLEYLEHACAEPELLKGHHAENLGAGVDTLYRM